MGCYCRICGRTRANERFSGRGHRQHVCKDCQRLPREQREEIDLMDELHGYLDQSNISAKNTGRLRFLSEHPNSKVREVATLILEIARVKPHKRRRWKFLAEKYPTLFAALKGLWGDDLPEDALDSLHSTDL